MRNWKAVSIALLLLVFVIGCAPVQQQTASPTTGQDTKPVVAEVAEPAPKEQPNPRQEISDEVKELLGKHKTKVSSIYYKYRGPETGANFYDFYAKGAKIKYKPYLELRSLDAPGSYDSIFIDKTARTAQSYCEAAYCRYKGKKEDLSYGNAYINSIFDWIDVTDAKKVGEELIEARSTWKLETNKGIVWVDSFYGVPLKVESSGKSYRFEQISVNSVQDSDVVPSS